MMYELKDTGKAMSMLSKNPLENQLVIQALQGRRGMISGVYVNHPSQIHSVMVVTKQRTPLNTEVTVFIESSSEKTTLEFLQSLPAGERFLFMLHREWMCGLLQKVFDVVHRDTQLYFQVDIEHFREKTLHDVRELTPDDENLVKSYPDEDFFLQYFARMAAGNTAYRCFGVIKDGKLVSCASTIRNEVAYVHTIEEHRRRRYAQSLVFAATKAILSKAELAKYTARSDNIPSIRTCESVGFASYLKAFRYIGTKS